MTRPARAIIGRVVALLIVLLLARGGQGAERPVRVGSKVFTESVVLGEMATLLIRNAGHEAVHRKSLGGTRIVYDALVAGDIDVYPEYTGTIVQEILASQHLPPGSDMAPVLARQGIGVSRSLGFNDTYAIGMTQQKAASLVLVRISDLANRPELKLGFSNEFLQRQDGWPLLRSTYHLPQTDVRGLDHDLAYRALAGGQIDATDLYSTDAEIAFYKLRVLEDNRKLFPEYQAVFLYRLDLKQRVPAAVQALEKLEGRIDAAAMSALNARVKLQKQPEAEVAADFLARNLSLKSDANASGLWAELRDRTFEHLTLVGISLAGAILVGIPLGIATAKLPWSGAVILGTVSVIYTIPSLALLVFMIGPLGIGTRPAIAALFLYSLFPLVRSTSTGLRSIPASLLEPAEVLGLSRLYRLWRIELPMASPAILSGVQTSAVVNIGAATLGALVGAGGYGQPILTGIRLADTRLILLGAIPSALLALIAQGVFSVLQRLLIPRGLRGPAAS